MCWLTLNKTVNDGRYDPCTNVIYIVESQLKKKWLEILLSAKSLLFWSAPFENGLKNCTEKCPERLVVFKFNKLYNKVSVAFFLEHQFLFLVSLEKPELPTVWVALGEAIPQHCLRTTSQPPFEAEAISGESAVRGKTFFARPRSPFSWKEKIFAKLRVQVRIA